MKQTAVEWLENEVQEIFKEWGGLDTNWLKRFEQAKAMEKEQIIDSYIESGANLEDIIKEAAEDYYNKQFKIN